MDRRDILLHGITKEMLGVEIGPYHAPLVPKREGFNSLSMDVYNTAELRERARRDRWLNNDDAAQIEDVDIVGAASEIAEAVHRANRTGQIDYVISSHNFEHLPNPVKFLQGCQSILKPNGFVTMAIPDKRGCFDYFRSLSLVSDFLDAYFEQRMRPSNAQIFLLDAYRSQGITPHGQYESWGVGISPTNVIPLEHLERSFENWKNRIENNRTDYVDSHCWTFIPESCELIFRELHFLGLTTLGVESVQGPNMHEFYIRLRNNVPKTSREDFYQRRAYLLRRCA